MLLLDTNGDDGDERMTKPCVVLTYAPRMEDVIAIDAVEKSFMMMCDNNIITRQEVEEWIMNKDYEWKAESAFVAFGSTTIDDIIAIASANYTMEDP